ncbi:MAG: Hpt domain-containing protein [Bacteroidales bacterium]
MEFKFINVDYIEEVCDNSHDLIREMAGIFREQISEFRNEMKELHDDEQYYDLGLLAHKAKSSIAIMGMDDLTHKLKELELNAKEGVKPESYPLLIDEFTRQTEEAMKELESYLESL